MMVVITRRLNAFFRRMPELRRATRSFRDKEVQGTNDDAQISKLSCVQAGYIQDPFIHYFVKTPSRRSPLINRGYFSRCFTLRMLIDAFLDIFANPAAKHQCQIVSLGAGFDTTWFCLKKKNRQPAKYIELDFQELISQKVNIIRSASDLVSLLSISTADCEESAKQGRLITNEYCLVSADLRSVEEVEHALAASGFDKRMPTLILAECVLVYLDPDESRDVVRHFGQMLSSAVFVIYEQIRPDDAFGRQMLKNLEARGCPLRGLKSTPSLEAHEQRFKENSWKKAMACDMDTLYKTVIPHAEHIRISKLELFDEFEEWQMIQEHYCICIGVNDSKGIFKGYGFKALQSQI